MAWLDEIAPAATTRQRVDSSLLLGWAAGVSVVVFAAAHAYQGKDVVRPILGGVVLQGIALLTWSILPGILVHAMA